MNLNKTLLAGVALPLISLTLSFTSTQAMNIRPATVIEADQALVKVAGEQTEEEILLKKRKKQAQMEEGGQPVESGDAPAEEPQPKKRKKQAQDESQQLQSNDDVVEQAPAEEPQPKKRKKQAQEVQSNDAVVEEAPAEELQPKKRKKQAQAQEVQSNDAVVEEAPDEEIQPKKRKKQAQDAGEQVPADEGQPAKKRKKQAQAQENGQDNEVEAGPDENGSTDVIETKKKRKKLAEEAPAETREQVKVKEAIAQDPARTTDTIELPVAKGAAVLDSDKDADNFGDENTRAKRKKQREQMKDVIVPKSDADAQIIFKQKNPDFRIEPVLEIKGEKLRNRPAYDRPDGRTVQKGDDIRIIFNINNQIVVRGDDNNRFLRNDSRIYYERLPDGRVREVITRSDGTRIVTVRNRYGEIIRRSRIDGRDREFVIFFSPDLDFGRERLYLRDAGRDLPPMRLVIPVEDYIIDTSSDPDRDYEDFLSQPPVEQVERVYSLDEVKYSARIRDKVRRIDLDTITFDTGSAEISMDQASSLRKVAEAINALLERDPGETFLIEGHTDAVGSDESNLVLSDQRAESVANVLSDLFDVPPENLATQGYGERFLKVDTDEEERLNRRVTIRRVTSLVRPVASAE